MVTYKKYLFILNDNYSISLLKYNIGDSSNFSFINKETFEKTKKLLRLNVNCVTLNDSHNLIVAEKGKEAKMSICNPSTLFSPYCMTYDPDIFQTYPIGWPIRDPYIQNLGYTAVKEGKPSCISFLQNKFYRQSPYTSHCSAYVAWAVQNIYGISLVPTQIGDWCHAAAEQRDLMFNLFDWWEKVDSVQAQLAANQGKLAIAAKKIDDPDREGYKQNGHIAVILPMTYKMSEYLQNYDNYPKTPKVINENTFIDFIKLYGPEIIQSGGLNFSHTIAANGFANYYNSEKGEIAGETPIDEVVEFFVYKLYTQTYKKENCKK